MTAVTRWRWSATGFPATEWDGCTKRQRPSVEQYLVCPLSATVETWQCNMADSMEEDSLRHNSYFQLITHEWKHRDDTQEGSRNRHIRVEADVPLTLDLCSHVCCCCSSMTSHVRPSSPSLTLAYSALFRAIWQSFLAEYVEPSWGWPVATWRKDRQMTSSFWIQYY